MVLFVNCLLGGAFFTGAGIRKMVSNHKIRQEYAQSELQWKKDLAEGVDGEAARDRRNQSLIENMEYISLERQIYFETVQDKGIARISNESQSRYYPCTAVWRFYSEHDEYAGETAWKTVVIVMN